MGHALNEYWAKGHDLLNNRNPKTSLKNAARDLTPHDLERAELFWIREAQQDMGKDIENGNYKRLCPKMREDGIYVIRGRSELWMDWNKLKGFGITEGFEWIFTSADAPWQNGVTEALIRSVKRAINASIGDSTLTFSELQTVLYEVANLLNERPIGRHPASPDDGAYLCPNDLLLGRATARIPSGMNFDERASNRKRFSFVQTMISSFWKKWTQNYFKS